MSRYAIVENGVVTNVILWDGIAPYSPLSGEVVGPIADDVAIGWTYSNGTFAAPITPTEESTEPPVGIGLNF